MLGRLKKGQVYPHKKNCKCFRCTGIPSKNRKFYYGKEHHNWKGDDAGYIAIHAWIVRQKGKPSCCEDCETTTAKKYHWANISGEYKRDINDFKRLCASCHKRFDYKLGRLKVPKTAFKKGHQGGCQFPKGHVPWNKGTKGIVKAWNKGLKGTVKNRERDNLGRFLSNK